MWLWNGRRARSSTDSNPTPLKSLSILLVEDCFDGRRFYAQSLTTAGASVDLECNARAALSAIQRRPDFYDAVVCDFQMPLVDGVEMTRAIREQQIDVPIIGLSADANPGFRLAWTEAGCTLLLPTPTTPTALIGAVSVAAARKRAVAGSL
jgi:CheY-like chemotaxis protein